MYLHLGFAFNKKYRGKISIALLIKYEAFRRLSSGTNVGSGVGTPRDRQARSRLGPWKSEAYDEILHDAQVGLVGQDEGRFEKREARGVACPRLHHELLERGSVVSNHR